MQTAGVTWYIDEEKTWAVSALNRYEFSTSQRDANVIPGQTYTLEWGVSKSLCKESDLGVVGYYLASFIMKRGCRVLPEWPASAGEPMLPTSGRAAPRRPAAAPR